MLDPSMTIVVYVAAYVVAKQPTGSKRLQPLDTIWTSTQFIGAADTR